MTHRVLFRCQSCKHIWALEYEPTPKGDDFERPYIRPRDGYEMKRSPRDDAWGGCPTCGHHIAKMTPIKGTYSAAHQCGRSCTHAKGGDCTCSCAGANHGRAWLPKETRAAP